MGAEECALVEQIASLRWRLRRAGWAEAALVNIEAERRMGYLAGGASKTVYPIDAGMMFDDGLIQTVGTLTRYESAIERQLNRAILMLERRQARRFERWKRGEAVRDISPAEAGSVETQNSSEPEEGPRKT